MNPRVGNRWSQASQLTAAATGWDVSRGRSGNDVYRVQTGQLTCRSAYTRAWIRRTKLASFAALTRPSLFPGSRPLPRHGIKRVMKSLTEDRKRRLALSWPGLTLILAISALFFGCAHEMRPLFKSYRPSGEQTNWGIEIVTHPGMPPSFELRINGKSVVTGKINGPRVTAEFQGKKIELQATFRVFEGRIIDVYVDGEHAASFRGANG